MDNYEYVDIESTKKQFDAWLSENNIDSALKNPDIHQMMLRAFRAGYESGYDEGMWDHISG
ncbi:hypothetical protein [uncultured Paraglaciecola sp.]|jgi:hypothetical protein|uniref:hypothetical protein n=1 Tax=uncultured Paraglaciecola sp. TaxID=1765024 RepID=UPI0026268A70|nr:hypothetical protein [uncultured Paraglaciecola sp.]